MGTRQAGASRAILPRGGLWAQTDAVRKGAVQAAAALTGGFLLAGASLLDRPIPAALALVAALPFGVPAVCAYGGAALGYLIFWGMGRAVVPAAAGFLIVAGLCLFTGLLPQERGWFMPLAASLLYGIIGFLELMQARFPLGDTVFLLAQSLLLGLCSGQFAKALQGDRLARRVLGLCLLAGCTAIRLPGGIPLGLILACGLSFLATAGADAVLWAAACGLAVDVAWTGGAPMTAVLAFGALLVRYTGLRPRFARAGLYLCCLAAGLLLAGGSQTSALLGALLGVLAAVFVPESLLERFSEETGSIPETRLAEVNRVSDVLMRVAQTLSRTRLQHQETQSAAIFDRAAEQTCKGCGRWFVCWQSRATDTYLALSRASGKILQKGEARREDLPVEFTARCTDVDGFLQAVNEALDDQLCRRQYQNRLGEARVVVAAQYATAARLLQRVAAPERAEVVLPAYTPELGYRARGIRGEEISGDHGVCFTCGEWYYVLLCDGMGTGEDASRESQAAIGILSDLIRAGLEAQDALETLNGVYILRGDGVFSTVDLLQVSLVTGEGYLLKWGAAPSYLKRAKGVEKLGGGSLPPGFSAGEGRASCTQLSMAAGEVLVLVSDGADSPRTQRQIAASIDASAKELAAQLVASAQEEDDCTAVVVRLRPNSAQERA